MLKKGLWLLISCLMAISLIMVSCGTATEEEEGQEEAITTQEEPKYGGNINIAQARNIIYFDEVVGWSAPATTLHLTNGELLRGNWAQGLAGTGETEWSHSGINRLEQKRGDIAESFEIVEPGKAIFKIRKGVHFALNPDSEASQLVNGREVTADDVVFSLQQVCKPPAWVSKGYNAMAAVVEITAPDNETVVMQTPPDLFFDAFSILTDFTHIVPREVVEKYGDMIDWENSVGTGPFILTDFVPDSAATLERNPNYWDKDPVGKGKGNQLPYLDSVKYIIITDVSTRIAGLRSAQIDHCDGVSWEDAADLEERTPELNSLQFYTGSSQTVSIRTDLAPFNDKQVRRALHMAIDFQGINDGLFGGLGILPTWPISYYQEYAGAFLGLDDPEMPDSVKELFEYNPERAKEILDEAGYPDGFKTNVICRNNPTEIDLLSVLKDMWSKIDVELVLDPKDPGMYAALQTARDFDQLMTSSKGSIGALYKGTSFRGNSMSNSSYIYDQKLEDACAEMNIIAYTDPAGADAIYKDLMKYVLDQAWAYGFPSAPSTTFWWPWIKNYHGEASIGFWNSPNWVTWAWLDTDLKQSMGH
ncbi:ABC transporter substrate-binding protein [Chloroflexota bacterium]